MIRPFARLYWDGVGAATPARQEATILTTDDDNRSNGMLRPAEVADLFGVTPKTVSRWAKGGKLPSIRTRGGHRRFHREDINRLLSGGA